MPTLPFNVTARWCQTPVETAETPLICCSVPLFSRQAKRGALLPPGNGARNIYELVPVPKSKVRAQALAVVCFTHIVMLKLSRLFTTPSGSVTYWLLLLLKFTALLL